MKNRNGWEQDILKEIDKHTGTFNRKDAKKYKLDLLRRVTKRVAGFCDDCSECRAFQAEIKKLVDGLGDSDRSSKESRKRHLKTLDTIVQHLQKQHALITDGQYISTWLGIGVAIGTALGVSMDNIGVWIGVGIALGAAIGSSMDAKAKKEGKVI